MRSVATSRQILRHQLESDTGKLFERLWNSYDVKQFEHSVELFLRRLDLVKFDRSWFQGKTCLDAGCGGGRNALAMAGLGAAEVQGIDLGGAGIADARRRASQYGLANAHFREASILDIPFGDDSFDMVWCAGVMMITYDADRALDELTRVCRPGGLVYLLVYAKGGLRWPLIETLRPIAARIGQLEVERAMEASGIAANKRRTFLDDLFCPKLDFYDWERLCRMLERRAFTNIWRWGDEARLDHEHSLADYRRDLESLRDVWAAGVGAGFNAGEVAPLFSQCRILTQSAIDTVDWFEDRVAYGGLSEAEAMEAVIGQGHHRVIATKEDR